MTPMGGIRLDVITFYIQNLPFLTTIVKKLPSLKKKIKVST